jgi:hypothetical protein
MDAFFPTRWVALFGIAGLSVLGAALIAARYATTAAACAL